MPAESRSELQSDTEQQRTVAQFAVSLVHNLMKSQLDGSDGLDAARNVDFFVELSRFTQFVQGLLNMCKQGSLESRHGALTVLHLFLGQIWLRESEAMRWQLTSLGVVPMLFEIATSRKSTAEMQRLAESCLQGFQGDEISNHVMGQFGMHGLMRRLIGEAVSESIGANQDHHSR